MADSSFSYTSIFRGKTLMVVIPHEDDEINVAGSTLPDQRFTAPFWKGFTLSAFSPHGAMIYIRQISGGEKL